MQSNEDNDLEGMACGDGDRRDGNVGEQERQATGEAGHGAAVTQRIGQFRDAL